MNHCLLAAVLWTGARQCSRRGRPGAITSSLTAEVMGLNAGSSIAPEVNDRAVAMRSRIAIDLWFPSAAYNGDFASQAERCSEIARNIATACAANRFATDARGANVSAMSPHQT
jgi:hypothetical protein